MTTDSTGGLQDDRSCEQDHERDRRRERSRTQTIVDGQPAV